MGPFATPRVFRGRLIPEGARLAGYAALAQDFGVDAPIRRPACALPTEIKGSWRETPDWVFYGNRMAPGPTFGDHLTFALRHERLDLLFLKRLFRIVPRAEVEAFVLSSPTGAYARRVWFLHEWLNGTVLDIPDAATGNYVDALDRETHFVAPSRNSPRHRVRDNMPGVPECCYLIRRTPVLLGFLDRDDAGRASRITSEVDRRILARAASFMLLADSQASFQIEGERAPRNRIERWGRAVMQAGQRPLSVAELERLRSIIIEDARHLRAGIRASGVFLGDRLSDGSPVPEFIGARPDDLEALMRGLVDANARLTSGGFYPVLQAAVIAFAFVMVHPFEDGNGRLHRFLIHHVLAERGFSPPGVLFPVSSAILDALDDYKRILRDHSGPLMDHIAWRPIPTGNVEVLKNDTSDLYALGDATAFAEFLSACVARTVELDLPREIAQLRAYDDAKSRILALFDMPDARVSQLILFVRQNGGTLSNRGRTREFQDLSETEVAEVEAIIRQAFGIVHDAGTAEAATP